jgi:predicted membrane protein
MNFRRCLSRPLASESARAVFLLLGIMSVVAASILFSATVVAAYTGDWGLPGRVAAFMLFVAAVGIIILVGALLSLALFFWPFLIAIIVMWAGYRLLYERAKMAKNEASSN